MLSFRNQNSENTNVNGETKIANWWLFSAFYAVSIVSKNSREMWITLHMKYVHFGVPGVLPCEEYKGEHDAWECTVIYRCAFVVIPVVILGLFCFLIHFRPLIPVVRRHSGMKFCFLMYVSTFLLIHHFKCYWRIVSFGEMLKGNILILLYERVWEGHVGL